MEFGNMGGMLYKCTGSQKICEQHCDLHCQPLSAIMQKTNKPQHQMDENYKRIKIQKFCQTACLLLFHGLVCADKKALGFVNSPSPQCLKNTSSSF